MNQFEVRKFFSNAVKIIKKLRNKASFLAKKWIGSAQRYLTFENTQTSEARNNKCVIMIHNTSMKRNVGGIIRIAAAFEADFIIFVGRKKSMQTFGAHGCQRRMNIQFFSHLNDAVKHVHENLKCSIAGVEIRPEAQSLRNNPPPFYGNTCFLLGNEGFGLSDQDANICDYFVYIPHSGSGTGSLNVSVACGIVLYQFKMVYCGSPEAERSEGKYLVKKDCGEGVEYSSTLEEGTC